MQIDRLVTTLDYSFAAEQYGVKLLRTVLGVLSQDTLLLMERYLKASGDKARERITALLADYSEESIREVITFGDAIGIDDVKAMVRILDGVRQRYEFSGANDLSRFDEDGRKAIRAFCTIQGVLYKMNPPSPENADEPYPVNPDIFRRVFQNPDRACEIARLLEQREGSAK